MNKNALFLAVILLMITSPFFAQTKAHPTLYFGAGAGFWRYQWVSMENFIEGYNTTNGSILTQKLTAPKGGFTPRIEVGGEWTQDDFPNLRLGITTYYTIPTAFSARSLMYNGEGRELKLVDKRFEYHFFFEFLKPGKNLGLGIDAGVVQASSKLYSGYVYKNGFVSYLPMRLNGIFKVNSSDMCYGLHATQKIGKRLALRLAWNWIAPGKAGSAKKLLGIKDRLDGYEHQYSNYIFTQYLPEDYANINNEYYYFVGNSPLINGTMSGHQFTATLTYNLLYGNLDF
ncbi:MAG: hypothetical protein K1X92_16705 [Bacteroidia bacterium]|nr:hypothetical protein [Bacteroidia bacterium]